MEDLAQPLLDAVKAHADWAAAIMFITAFIESSAFISLLFPGTTMLITAGALIHDGALPVIPVLVGALVGAVLGGWASFWLGRRFGGGVARLWPLSRNPDLLPAGIRFFARHGGKSVFIGRFYGPIRAVIPLAAGIMRMPRGRFWVANIASALLWVPLLLFAGHEIGDLGGRLIGAGNVPLLLLAGLTLFGLAGIIWAAVRAARSKM
jgi:membrane protein DedA with SNARE-associated domain